MDDSWFHDAAGELDRLTHLVFLDGRLVDHWSAPVEGSRWELHAQRLDLAEAARRPAPAPPVQAPPRHDQVLDWLDAVCGGRVAVEALADDPLVDDGRDLPEADTHEDQERLAEAWALLEQISLRYFDAEITVALRRGLIRCWERDRWAVTSHPSAAHLAGGLLWAIGKANLLLHPCTHVTLGALQQDLGLGGSLSTAGQLVRHALAGWAPSVTTPWPAPNLLVLGDAGLLRASVRGRLVVLRDRARHERAAAAGDVDAA